MPIGFSEEYDGGESVLSVGYIESLVTQTGKAFEEHSMLIEALEKKTEVNKQRLDKLEKGLILAGVATAFCLGLIIGGI